MLLHADTHVCLNRQNRIEPWRRCTKTASPGHIRHRNRPPSGPFVRSAHRLISTKVGSSIHRVRPASGFLLVAQSKATRRGDFSYNSGLVQPRRSRLGTNDKVGVIWDAVVHNFPIADSRALQRKQALTNHLKSRV